MTYLLQSGVGHRELEAERVRPNSMRRIAALAALTLVLLGACGGDDDTVAAGDDDETTTTTTTAPATDETTDDDGTTTTTTKPKSTTTRPGGGTTMTTTTTPATPAPAAGLAVQIRTGGGFVPVQFNFTNTPEFSLYADGRVIVTGPTTLEFPGKALPNLLEGRVNTQVIANAIQGAKSAGVFNKPDLGNPPIADAPSTTFTVVDGDQKATLDVYALDFSDGIGLSPAQKEARSKLSAFRDEMTNVGQAARDAYKASAVSVLVLPYVSAGGSEPAPGSADWPMGNLGAGGIDQFGGRCLGFTGADTARVLDAAAQARSNTRWQSGGKEWSLSFRLELPGGVPCAPSR